MFPKAHLTSHSRISDSRWVITPSWLSRSLRPFLYSSLYASTSFECLLLLVLPYHFCTLLCPIWVKCSLVISNFLEEISRLSHSIVFLYLLHCSRKKAFFLSPCYSLELSIQLGVSFPFPFPFASLFFSAIFKVFSTIILPCWVSFALDGFNHCLLYSVTNLCP